MKHVSVVEVYTTNFSLSIFLPKIYENFMYIEKMYFNESLKSFSQQLLVEVSYCIFNFLSVLKQLDCYYNEYPVMQRFSLYLKLTLKPALFSVFLLLLER